MISEIRIGDPFPNDSTPAIKYFLSDHLHNINVIIDTNGSLISREEYTPYGLTCLGKFSHKRYRFSGKEKDEESGAYYFGARYYIPWIVRWISCDPLGISSRVNLYQYASCNPINITDTTGLQEEPDAGELQKVPEAGAAIPGGVGDKTADELSHGGQAPVEQDLPPDAKQSEPAAEPPPPSENNIVTPKNVARGVKKYLENTAREIVIMATYAASNEVIRYGDNAVALDVAVSQSVKNIESGRKEPVGAGEGVGCYGAAAVDLATAIKGSSSAAYSEFSILAGELRTSRASEKALQTALKLGFTPEEGTSVFWTGLGKGIDAQAVSGIANSLKLGDTLAETWGGAYLNALERSGVKLSGDIWLRASAEYASETFVSGSSVSLIHGGIVRPGTTWLEVERPILRDASIPHAIIDTSAITICWLNGTNQAKVPNHVVWYIAII